MHLDQFEEQQHRAKITPPSSTCVDGVPAFPRHRDLSAGHCPASGGVVECAMMIERTVAKQSGDHSQCACRQYVVNERLLALSKPFPQYV